MDKKNEIWQKIEMIDVRIKNSKEADKIPWANSLHQESNNADNPESP
jgi:hypothetical protein